MMLSSRLSSLSLAQDEVVVIVGLANAAQYNYRAARIIEQPAPSGDRYGICLLHGTRKKLSVRRRHLLRSTIQEEREALLTRIILERQCELRVCRDFLSDQLHGEEGLLLHIASFFEPRETMALTTGFAMGRIIPSWCCATLTAEGQLGWRPLHQGGDGWDGANVPISSGTNGRSVPDGIVRIDCAVIDVGTGRYLVAGGGADHPSRARAFFSSAFIYDALTHVATPLPDMPCRRHGCDGALLDGKAYVVGGAWKCAGSPLGPVCVLTAAADDDDDALACAGDGSRPGVRWRW